jgi:hypothetical protein
MPVPAALFAGCLDFGDRVIQALNGCNILLEKPLVGEE